ncbi:MAG: SpoIIIAH-like family protein [Bacillota bacterium]
MVFVNFRRIFLTVLFILGAGTLLVGYNGVVGMFLKEQGVIKKAGEEIHRAQPGARAEPVAGLTGLTEGAGVPLEKDNFFVEYRLQRERARGQQIEILKDIVNSPSTAGETRQLAQEQLLGISKSVTREARMENLLKARGYRDAVVCMDQKGVTVVVESQVLIPAEEAKIIELVSKESGFGEQGILIIPKR